MQLINLFDAILMCLDQETCYAFCGGNDLFNTLGIILRLKNSKTHLKKIDLFFSKIEPSIFEGLVFKKIILFFFSVKSAFFRDQLSNGIN